MDRVMIFVQLAAPGLDQTSLKIRRLRPGTAECPEIITQSMRSAESKRGLAPAGRRPPHTRNDGTSGPYRSVSLAGSGAAS